MINNNVEIKNVDNKINNSENNNIIANGIINIPNYSFGSISPSSIHTYKNNDIIESFANSEFDIKLAAINSEIINFETIDTDLQKKKN